LGRWWKNLPGALLGMMRQVLIVAFCARVSAASILDIKNNNVSHDYINENNNVSNAYSPDECKGMVTGALRERPPNVVCGDHCQRWEEVRGSVDEAITIKVLDVVFNTAEIILGTLFSFLILQPERKGILGFALKVAAITWFLLAITADIALPTATAVAMGRSASAAEEFADAKCFEDGQGLDKLFDISDFLKGVWQDGLYIVHVTLGCLDLVARVVELRLTGQQACNVGAFIFIASTVNLVLDVLLFKRIQVVGDDIYAIESVILHNGIFDDESKAAFFWGTPMEAHLLPDTGYIAGLSSGLVVAVVCCFCSLAVCRRRCT